MEMNRDQVLDLARKYRTPLYLYDGNRIKTQVERLKRFFPTDAFHIHFAIKALSNRNILKLINQLGCGFDTVSIEEMQIALQSGIDPKEINFTPNGARREEYLFAIEHGIGLHVDNLEMLEYIGTQKPGAEVILRFNPSIRAGGHHQLRVGDEDSKFGLNLQEAELIYEVLKSSDLKVVGVHVHVGSDISTVEKYVEAFEFLLRKAHEFRKHLKYINIGGGYKVAYRLGDHATDMEMLGQAVVERFEEFRRTHHQDVQLLMEPGKFLVSEAGTFLVEVTTVKEFKRRNIAFVNSGFNHLIRPMYYGAFHAIENLTNVSGEYKPHEIVGYLCETDTFATNRELRVARAGDILAFSNAGAYCYMMASNYNSRVRPAEVLLLDNQDYLIRRHETLEDILKTEEVVDF